MSLGDTDISWQALRRIVQDWGGTSAELVEFVPLHGGAISTTLELHLSDGKKIVLKVSPHRVDRSYEREAYQLTLLKNCGLPVPEVYCWKIGSLDDPFSYVMIQHMPGVDLAEAKKQSSPEAFDHLQHELAEVVSRLHDNTNQRYMRVMEGGPSFDNWPAFYRSVYDTIWSDVSKDPHLPKHCKKVISKIHDRLDRYLAHTDQPRLVHWDIWNTNILAAPNGDGRWHVTAILDPNCKYAHAEAEIAYLELFHTVTPIFMKAYQQHHKLSAEYHKYRKAIYQLYPMINHVHVFGESYVKPLAAAVERIEHLM